MTLRWKQLIMKYRDWLSAMATNCINMKWFSCLTVVHWWFIFRELNPVIYYLYSSQCPLCVRVANIILEIIDGWLFKKPLIVGKKATRQNCCLVVWKLKNKTLLIPYALGYVLFSVTLQNWLLCIFMCTKLQESYFVCRFSSFICIVKVI